MSRVTFRPFVRCSAKLTVSSTAERRKAFFTIGGWTGSVYFSDHMATAAKRTAFANSIETFRK